MLVTCLILTKTLSFHWILNVGLHLEWSFQFWHHLYLKFRFAFKAVQNFKYWEAIYMLNRQYHTIEIYTWHIIDNNKGQYILSIAKSRVSISISEQLYVKTIPHLQGLFVWLAHPRQRVFVDEVLFLCTIVLHIWNKNANSTFGNT